MQAEWTAAELASALGRLKRSVQYRAVREGWHHSTQSSPTGPVHVYRLTDLPADVQSACAAYLARTAAPAAPPSATDRHAAAEREATLAAWESYWRAQPPGTTRADARRAFCADRAVSPRTLRRWESARASGGGPALAPRTRGRGPASAIPEAAARLFEALYLDQGQPTIRHCWRIVVGALGAEFDLPGYHAFARHARTLDPAVVTLARQGPKAAAQAYGGYIERDLSALRPNDWWVGDHHRVDILCQGAKPGRVTRPWLTAWIDFASRKLVGWHLFSGEPSSDAILLAFRSGAIANGVPRGIYVDNGQDYRSKAITGAGRLGARKKPDPASPEAKKPDPDCPEMRSLATMLDLDTTFALPYNARAKLIERWFCTLKDQFCRLWPSFTGGTTVEKPEQLATVPWERLPTVEQVRERFAAYVAQYHAEPHAALGGQTPAQAWAAHMERRRTLPEWALRLACLRASRPVRVGRHGVRLLGTRYWCDELLGLFEKRVVLRYDPADVSEVHVYDAQDRWLCTAANTAAIAHGADSETLRTAMAAQRRRMKRIKEAREAYGKMAEGESALDLYLGRATEPEPQPAAAVVELVPARLPERPGPTTKTNNTDQAAAELASVASLVEARRAAELAAATATAQRAADDEFAGLTALDFARSVVMARTAAKEA